MPKRAKPKCSTPENDSVEPLDPHQIIRNVEQLRERIQLRFQGHAIVKRADRLVKLAKRAAGRREELARPRYGLLAFCVLDMVALIIALALATMLIARTLRPSNGWELMELLQGLEAGIGCIVFLSVVFVFFWSLEKRMRRRDLLREIDHLRNFLHLINMGQLDKEPVRLTDEFQHTSKSPSMRMDARSMERYLSHTQKMAHYVAEIGCLYANVLVDDPLGRAADQLREFASDVSRSAGEKIMILSLRSLRS